MQEGSHVVRNIRNIITERGRRAISLVDEATVASIGRTAAQVGGLKLSGLIACLAWLGVHFFGLSKTGRRFQKCTLSEAIWRRVLRKSA
jgi:NADH:ubiquinone reductase (H+-translocating)